MRQMCWIVANVCRLAFGVNPAWAGDAAWGTIKSVSADKNQFVLVQDGNKEYLYTLTDDGRVRLGDKDAKVGDLKARDEVVLYFTIKKGLYAGSAHPLSGRREVDNPSAARGCPGRGWQDDVARGVAGPYAGR